MPDLGDTGTRDSTSPIALKWVRIDSNTDISATDSCRGWVIFPPGPDARARAHHIKLTLCHILPGCGEGVKKIQPLLGLLTMKPNNVFSTFSSR